jgi:hypothetical protein
MAGLNDTDKEVLYTINANVTRAMHDIQTIYTVQQTLLNEIAVLKTRVQAQDEIMEQLLDDKKSLFRWALGVIASAVVSVAWFTTNE